MEHRLRRRRKVAITAFLKDAYGQVMPVTIRDVSEDGAYLELEGHNFERSARVDFEYVVNDRKASRVVALRAFVVHVLNNGIGVMYMSKSEAALY